MTECTRVIVEGKTEELLLKRVYNLPYDSEDVYSLNGKENVIKNFEGPYDLQQKEKLYLR